MTDWTYAYSDGEHVPVALDTTSSEVYVFERKDFELVESPATEEGEEPTKQWRYLERSYTKAEYSQINATAEKVELKHESDIVDEYTAELIEQGLLG